MIQLNALGNTRDLSCFPIRDLNDSFPSTIFLKDKSFKKIHGNASEYIVPFILNIYNIKESELTKAISKCIIDLDNLAIKIDSIIDSKNYKGFTSLSIRDFNGLSKKIEACLIHLKDRKNHGQLVEFTINCINVSFKYNTTERHLVYDLGTNISSSRCTTFYLYPLIDYLIRSNKKQVNSKPIFILLANCVQLLDDFVDLFHDVDSEISTPISKRFIEIYSTNLTSAFVQTPFTLLVNEVKIKISCFLNEIINEIKNIEDCQRNKKILAEFYSFYSELEDIPVPSSNNRLVQENYLQRIYNIIPPILCYIG